MMTIISSGAEFEIWLLKSFSGENLVYTRHSTILTIEEAS